MQFLSNSIGSASNHPLISSPQLIQHINGNPHYTTNSIPLPHLSNSHTSNHTAQVEAPESPGHISRTKELELLQISHHNKEAARTNSRPMSNSSSRHSPTMIASTQGGGSNLTHLSQPPYGRLHNMFFQYLTILIN